MPLTTHELSVEYLKGTDFWLFWRKDLRIRKFYPIFRNQEIFKCERGMPRSAIELFFEQRLKGQDSKIVKFHISKYRSMYFTVAQTNRVHRSKDCNTIREFEREYCRYFKRSRILPAGCQMAN